MHLFLIVLFISTLSSCNAQTSAQVNTIDVAAFSKVLDSLDNEILLDVRTPEETKEGIIPGALTIDFHSPDFQKQLEGLDKSRPIAVYCRSGNRSGKSIAILQSLGFTQIYDLKGGIVAWQLADKPIVKP